ncbi:hypothetical protein Rs2_44699 [Raphanus sativus]|nr:hypothetical protein Rs2_44699 [Raphanus sativus]
MFLGCGRPVAPLLKSYANVETLSISELNDFVITAPSQDIGLFVPEKLLESSWTRDGATFPVQTVPGSFNGLSHRSHCARYRVEMSIADETGEGLFVGFDGAS